MLNSGRMRCLTAFDATMRCYGGDGLDSVVPVHSCCGILGRPATEGQTE